MGEIDEGRIPLVVVGAGPAGLAASVQARRDMVEHVLVSDEPVGGLLGAAWRIDNLPGYPGSITGEGLARRLARQARELDLPLVTDRVLSLARAARGFDATLSTGGSIRASCVILATGTRPRPFDVPGSDEAARSGLLHRDARTLPGRLRKAHVAVVGSGDAALDTALSVTRRGGRATVLMRGQAPRANPRLVARIEGRAIDLRRGVSIGSVDREGPVLRLAPLGLAADHLVVCIGREPEDRLLRMLVADGESGGGDVRTPVPGLFVAGDLVAGHDRFIATAMGDGQRAALAAARVLRDALREP